MTYVRHTAPSHLSSRVCWPRVLAWLAVIAFCLASWFIILEVLSASVRWTQFELGRAVEPPPQIYATGPTQTGRTKELDFDDLRALQIFCHRYAGTPGPTDRPGAPYTQACYSPMLDIVALPTHKAWPSRREIEQLREHEWAHARGWRHNPGGAGTDWTASLPPRSAGTAPDPKAAP